MPLADITPISPLFFTIPYLVIIGLVNFAKKWERMFDTRLPLNLLIVDHFRSGI